MSARPVYSNQIAWRDGPTSIEPRSNNSPRTTRGARSPSTMSISESGMDQSTSIRVSVSMTVCPSTTVTSPRRFSRLQRQSRKKRKQDEHPGQCFQPLIACTTRRKFLDGDFETLLCTVDKVNNHLPQLLYLPISTNAERSHQCALCSHLDKANEETARRSSALQLVENSVFLAKRSSILISSLTQRIPFPI